MTLTLNASLSKVIEDVGRTVAYAGAKTDDYSRLSTSEEDSQLLLRFASQAANSVGNALKRNIIEERLNDESYKLVLEVSNAFDLSLESTLLSNLESYMTMSIASRWLGLSKRDEASDYQAVANELLHQLSRCVNSKKRPTRPLF